MNRQTDSARRHFLSSVAALAAGSSIGLPTHAAAPNAKPVAPRRMLIRNGVVLSVDPKIGNFDRADVLIENGKIIAVQPNLAATGAMVIDAASQSV